MLIGIGSQAEALDAAAIVKEYSAYGERLERYVGDTTHYLLDAVEAGKNKVGPSLHGIMGRKAGSVEGFTYSDPMKNSGITWNEAELDKYLTNPKKDIPGNKMAVPGLPKPDDRANVIAYLKTFKPAKK